MTPATPPARTRAIKTAEKDPRASQARTARASNDDVARLRRHLRFGLATVASHSVWTTKVRLQDLDLVDALKLYLHPERNFLIVQLPTVGGGRLLAARAQLRAHHPVRREEEPKIVFFPHGRVCARTQGGRSRVRRVSREAAAS